jgi:CDP-4-dehydro-6-deoxyglucose reductase, E1
MIKLIKSSFYKEKQTKQKLVHFLLKTKQLSFGKECEKFEYQFSRWQGREDCILVNSGSSANLALIQALLNLGKIRKGDPVGFSAVTWSTNVMPLIQLGLQPVPVDVSLDTLNISPATLLARISKKPIRLLFLSNLLGFCDDIAGIRTICKKKNILLIEDNCESLGSVYKGTKLGNFGYASTFSFYVGHHMSTIEGGAICTDDKVLATMLRLVRAHGWDRNLSFSKQTEIRNKFQVNSSFFSRYTFYDLGFNLRPTEITGYLGQCQLRYLDTIIQKRKANFELLSGVIYKNTEKYFPIRTNHMDLISNFAIPVICRSGCIRDNLVKRCNTIIEVRPIVGGDITEQPFFSKFSKSQSFNCPNANLIHNQGLYFGNNPELTKKEIQTFIRIFQ